MIEVDNFIIIGGMKKFYIINTLDYNVLFQTNIDVDINKIIHLGIPELLICGNENLYLFNLTELTFKKYVGDSLQKSMCGSCALINNNILALSHSTTLNFCEYQFIIKEMKKYN